MQNILVALKAPDGNNHERVGLWNDLLERLANAALNNPGVDVLADGVLLLRASSALPILGLALALADQRKFPARVLFVESGTEWAHPPTA